ncbi:MAG: ABC transporter ATP-binding protein [bacterium]|nr:ABC transporter ATP-binding protein [bacterium]
MGDGQIDVLRGIDFEVEKGEIIAVMGPSGVGKSTLLHILGGLDNPSSGRVYVDGVDVFGLSDADRAHFRNRHVGFVFQFHHLLSDFTALENVMMPLLISGMSHTDARQPAAVLLGSVGLSHRVDHLPAELSGGEAQRVAVARALVANPKVVLADEPSGNLDAGRSSELHALIWELARSRGQTFVIATHDAELAKRADRVVRMADGGIVA